LIVVGGIVFYLNFESASINVTAEEEEWTLLDYTAPENGLFPHYLIVAVDTTRPVQIVETLDGVANIVYTDDGSGKFTVEPGESILVLLRNPRGATGGVHTTFYGDTWNYAAYTLFMVGSLAFAVWLRQSQGEGMETL
jgi:hypothetical protein